LYRKALIVCLKCGFQGQKKTFFVAKIVHFCYVLIIRI
jgi:hypothetical protein